MSRRKFKCMDCGVDTGKIHEHYFIHTELWLKATDSIKGMLCIEHLEARLGRKLNRNDFTDASINNPKFEDKSQRLMDRLKFL